MKKTLLFLFAFAVALTGFTQDFEYQVTPNEDSTMFRLVITDKSSGEAPYPAKDYNTLTFSELRSTLYRLIEDEYNDLGNAEAYTFFKTIKIQKSISVLDSLGLNNYKSEVKKALEKSFNGEYVYEVIGTPVRLNVRVDGLKVINIQTNKQLAEITPSARQYITVVTPAEKIDLYSENKKVFVGRNGNGNVVVLRKKSG